MSDYVLAADSWPNNAALIADVARMGYLRREWLTLDPTYGKGNWWKLWVPDVMVTNDLDPETDTDYHLDFRTMPDFRDGMFDAVAFDPPYVSPGGRDTSGIKAMYERYGQLTVPTSPLGLQRDVINPGLKEVARVTKPGGIILVKCKDYVSSGQVFWGTDHTQDQATRLGLRKIDRFIMVGEPGPQSQTSQVHTRNNFSVLFVFKKARRLH